MGAGNSKKQKLIMIGAGAIAVIWLGFLIAPALEDGLLKLITEFDSIISHPFRIRLCEKTAKTILVLLMMYGVTLGVVLSNERNYRKLEEYGSSKWGKVEVLRRKYAHRNYYRNIILTQHVVLSLVSYDHRRNLNVMVVGTSGTGKSTNYVMENAMQLNTSYIMLDPKGELVRSLGHMLENNGYRIKIVDLIHMEKSHCYNPFVYLRNDNDIQRLVTNLFKNTTPKGSNPPDPFWEHAAEMLLMALVSYLRYEAPPEEQNFAMVIDMILAGGILEDCPGAYSTLDTLFDRLKRRDPDHIALRYYNEYHTGVDKTQKSIQITLLAHMAKFNIASLANLTHYDEMELRIIGTEKTAVFCVIPDNDSSFNFLAGMLYTQLFQELYDVADAQKDGRLPVHVQFIMDEFANVALPDDFEKILSTMRSREISASIILQNIAQLKALFKDQWQSIVGNCDSFLYLGGNDHDTHEYISKLLGKETIDMNTYTRTRGRNGNYSTNWQLIQRDLMTPDEVGRLDNDDAILLIRGEYPIRDQKFDINKHPNISQVQRGGAEPYTYGEDRRSYAALSKEKIEQINLLLESAQLDLSKYELLTEEELSEQFEKNKKEKQNEKPKKQ